MAAVAVVLVGVGVYLVYEAVKGNVHPVTKASVAFGVTKKGG